jgi:hypothetical protein
MVLPSWGNTFICRGKRMPAWWKPYYYFGSEREKRLKLTSSEMLSSSSASQSKHQPMPWKTLFE